jgi:hypothetical protein
MHRLSQPTRAGYPGAGEHIRVPPTGGRLIRLARPDENTLRRSIAVAGRDAIRLRADGSETAR